MDVDREKIRALAGFRSALRRFTAFSEEATRGAGVSAQQYQAMLAVKAADGGSLQVGALASELLLKANAAVQLVDRLEAQGLVTRERSDDDRRTVRVSLTEQGDALVVRLAALHLDQLAKRRKQFADVLRQLKQTQAG
jgi:DNA-binding MarR family transcriptional regulator